MNYDEELYARAIQIRTKFKEFQTEVSNKHLQPDLPCWYLGIALNALDGLVTVFKANHMRNSKSN